MPIEIVTANTWNEKVAKSDSPIVVNFGAERCGFCKALDPLYARLSDQYGNRLTFAKIMVDEPQNQEVAQRASIEGTPTLKFYCRGREVGEHIGYAIEPVLKKKIDEMLVEMEACLANSTPLKG